MIRSFGHERFHGRKVILFNALVTAFCFLWISLQDLVEYSGSEWLQRVDFSGNDLGQLVVLVSIGLSLLLSPVSLILALRARKWLFLIVPLILPLFLFFQEDLQHPGFVFLFGFIAFLFFLYYGRVRSWQFIIFCLALWVLLNWLVAVAFFALATTFKMVLYFIRDNFHTFRTLGFFAVTKSLVRATLLWSPMLLVVVPSFWLSKKIETEIGNAVYNHSFVEDCNQKEEGFVADLDCSLEIAIAEMEAEIDHQVTTIDTSMTNFSEKVPREVGNTIRNSVVEAPKVSKSCRWYQAGCKIKKGASNVAIGATNSALRGTFNKLGDGIESYLAENLSEGNKSSKAKLAEAQTKSKQQLRALKSQVRESMLWSYYSLRLFSFISDLLFFFVVFKSFSYVFARVLFSADTGGLVNLAIPGQDMRKGDIRKTGNTYTIPAATRKDFLVSRRYEPAGRAPKLVFPQRTTGIIPRLFNGCYGMNHLVMEAGRSAVKFNAAIGIEFIEWKLQPDETVIFSYRDFVAMSEDVTLSRLVSLKVDSLLLGKMIYTAATGPGVLILRSKGNAVCGEERAATASVPQSRVIAWQQNASFHVESELNVKDIFFSGVYLKKKPADLVVIDSDQTGKAKSGISRFFLHFLLPH